MRSPKTTHARRSRGTLVFFALAFVVLTCVFPYIHGINNPNENVRTYMTMAIVEGHTFHIDDIVRRHGWVNDMATAPDKITGEKHLYSVKAPAVSYAGVPVYWALTKIAPRFHRPVPTIDSPPEEKIAWLRLTTAVLRLFVVQLPCFAFLVWLERWLRRTTDDVVLRLTAVAATGFGTNYLAYALMFVSHSLFAMAAFASFAIVTRERELHPIHTEKRRLSRAFLAGFFAGFATLLEYHALPVSVCLALYALTAFWRPTRLAVLTVGGLLNAAALTYFQWRAFDNPLMPGHRMQENQAFAQLHKQGFFGLEAPSLDVAKEITFSPTFGFLGTSPFMALGLLAIPFALFAGFGTRRERRQRRLATFAWMITMAMLWTTVCSTIVWRGGWTIGPRYLGAAPPFFAYGAVCALEAIAGRSRPRRAVARGLAGGLAIASAVSIGTISMLFNTIPEEIARPFAHFAWPMLRAGFVPHHALELFGAMSPTFWYVVLGCMIGAVAVAALWPWRDSVGSYALRLAILAAALYVGMKPALSDPQTEEPTDLGAHVRRGFAAAWEPAGRDRITTLRLEAEQHGDQRPCLWQAVADTERLVGMIPEAERDERRTGMPPGACGAKK
jgi:hypothetical protein